MIATQPATYPPSPATGVSSDPLPPLKKAQRKNPIPALKKELWNGFPREKDFSNRSAPSFQFRRRNTIGNRGKNAASVTTSHVFQPNQRRNVTLSLRFWLPNSLWPTVSVTRQGPGGGGGRDESSWRKHFDRKGTQKILPNRVLRPVLHWKKKRWSLDVPARVPRRRRQITGGTTPHTND